MTREEAIAVLNMVEAHGSLTIEAKDMAIKALEIVEEFEKAQIITGGRLNGRTYAYKCGLEDGKRKALEQEPEHLVNESGDLVKDLVKDTISRQTVLSKIKEVCFSEEWLQFRVDNGSNGQRDFLINYIENMPPVTPTTCIAKVTFDKDDLQELVDEKVRELAQHMERKWIPCSERLPEKNGKYLAYIINKKDTNLQYIMTCEYYEGDLWNWFPDDDCASDNVVAWMPLPEQYETEMESEE